MSHRIQKTILAGLCTLAAGAAMADVTVNYIDSDHFTDLPRLAAPREVALKEFTQHFQKLSATLPPGQDLVIDVLDIDLAGYPRPSEFNTGDPRIVERGAYYAPHVVLHYTLSEHGRQVAGGTVNLTDRRVTGARQYPAGQRYPREMRLVDRWWHDTIEPARLAQR